jgi:DNA-binding XRE family transcriptional regulator
MRRSVTSGIPLKCCLPSRFSLNFAREFAVDQFNNHGVVLQLLWVIRYADREGVTAMRRKQFAEIRRHLGKTQSQMAQILGVSPKAIQSFEQGWRNIPVHIERQILLVLALKNHASRPASQKDKPCWLMRDCPVESRQDCPAWQFDAGHLCWFINGTICHGSPQGSWKEKMKICRDCEVYRSIIPLRVVT